MKNYDLITQECINNNIFLFQSHQFHDDDQKHCQIHWNLLGSPANGVWADMGSGIGTFAYYLSQFASELTIYSVTNSPLQHQLQEEMFKKIDSKKLISKHESYLSTSLADQSVDYITFNESIGYENCEQAFYEISRILKPGGRLFIKNVTTERKNSVMWETIEKIWHYSWFTKSEIINTAEKFNLRLDKVEIQNLSCKKWWGFYKNSNKMQNWFPMPAELVDFFYNIDQPIGLFYFTRNR
jgi:ubiquinone/menaquinone biosynthesis C-methylase UbiE